MCYSVQLITRFASGKALGREIAFCWEQWVLGRGAGKSHCSLEPLWRRPCSLGLRSQQLWWKPQVPWGGRGDTTETRCSGSESELLSPWEEMRSRLGSGIRKPGLSLDWVTSSPSLTCGFASGSHEPPLGVPTGSRSQFSQAVMQGERGGVHSGPAAPLGPVSPDPGHYPRTFSLLDEKDGNGWAGEITSDTFAKLLPIHFLICLYNHSTRYSRFY